MKTIKQLFALTMIFSSLSMNSLNTMKYENNLNSINIQSSEFLENIQLKIKKAFNQSISEKNNDQLDQISNKLNELYLERKDNLILYWRSYLQFYKAIYYLQNGDNSLSEQEIDKGISWMKKMKNKNSEEYALLSMLKGFSIQFKGFRAMFIGISSGSDLDKALQLDTQNIRAQYVAGSNDFYKPKSFGGGKKTEGFLLKAIALPSQKNKNPYLPSWGKEEAYDILIKYYLREEKWDLAKKYYNEAISKYPKSYLINQLTSKVK